MIDWTDGYVADVGYTYGYYNELNPLRVKLALLSAGWAPPKMATACELGFGQGMSTNIHAAASVTQWWGTDFNPSQVSFARELASASEAEARLFDESFDQFSRRTDLPDFDFIGLHGIWSWISDENRRVIVDFVRRKLNVGGVLYISYNTLPGWAPMVPMRHLLTEHVAVLAAPGQGMVTRIDAALEFSEKLLSTNPIFARANPTVAERIKKITGQSRNYLAHEYFNRDWHPMHFSDLANWLAPAKLTYTCSAEYMDQVDAANLTPDQQSFMREIPDRMFKEVVRDFMVNQQFRRDYWVKGPRKLSNPEQIDALNRQELILAMPRTDVSLKARGALGEVTMQEGIYGPILDVLEDQKSKTIAEVAQAATAKNVTIPQTLQAVQILLAKGDVVPAQDGAIIGNVLAKTRNLNTYLLGKAHSSNDISYLASPVTGGGVAVDRIQQLFLLARAQGHQTADEFATFAWASLTGQGQRLMKDGKPLESSGANIAELTTQAKIFLEKKLPILRALEIAR